MSTFENTFYLSSVSFHRAKSALAGTRFGDLRSVPETGSTNADMRDLLASAALTGDTIPAPMVLLADHQTAGRGRLDRSWQAPPGSSVLMSIGMPVAAIDVSRRGLATTCLALAVTDATAAIGLSQVRIKWPNDLVVEPSEPHSDSPEDGPGYRKLGGILAELHPIPGIGDCLVLGIGLNVNWPEIPPELVASATSLRHLAGDEVDRDDLVAAILLALDRTWLPAIESTDDDLSAFWSAYAARSATLGRRVRVELPGDVLLGEATGVTTDGALEVVDDAGRVHTVTVGDVVHLRPV